MLEAICVFFALLPREAEYHARKEAFLYQRLNVVLELFEFGERVLRLVGRVGGGLTLGCLGLMLQICFLSLDSLFFEVDFGLFLLIFKMIFGVLLLVFLVLLYFLLL